MFVHWLLLAMGATSVVARSAPPWPRRDVHTLDAASSADSNADVHPRHRREISPGPSNIFWIHNHATPHNVHKKSKISSKDDPAADGRKHVMLNRSFKIKSQGRYRRAFPSTDDVSEDPASQWIRKSLPKTNFITAREHRTEKAKQPVEEDFQNLSVKTNEIPEPSFQLRSDVNRVTVNNNVNNNNNNNDKNHNTNNNHNNNNNKNNNNNNNNNRNGAQEDTRSILPNRRIIYYADLPEISSKPVDNPTSQRRYEPLPLRPKYPRESSHEENFSRSKPLSFDDRYRYRPTAPQTSRYTIIDADPPSDRNNYPSREINYQDLPNTKYNKIPVPYRQNELPRNPQQYYDTYSRNRESTQNPGGSVLRSEPYRDYNPRQPAPWSVQIGTRLTVKDDGRPIRREDGRPMRQEDGQRRFYVNSQEKPRFSGGDGEASFKYSGDGDNMRERYRLL